MKEETLQGTDLSQKENYGTIAERFSQSAKEPLKAESVTQETTIILEPAEPKNNDVESIAKNLTPLQKAIIKADKDMERKNAQKEAAKKQNAVKADNCKTSELCKAVSINPEIKPLEHWKADEKVFFESLPIESKKKVLDMYKGIQNVYERKTLETAEKQRAYDIYENAFKPYEAMFQDKNFNKVDYIKGMLELDKFSNENPAAFIREFLKQKGITYQDIANYGAPKNSGVQPDHNTYRQNLSGKDYGESINQRSTALDNTNNEDAVVREYIEKFKTAKDSDGNYKYPYFEAVGPEMAKLHQVTGITDLDSLYNEALWLNPKYRSQIIEQEKQKAVNDITKKNEISKIKTAKGFNINSSGNANAQVSKKSLRDIIEEAEQNQSYK